MGNLTPLTSLPNQPQPHCSPYPLERELPHRLDCHGTLYSHQHARTDEYLTRLGLVAKPRGYVGYRPDGGVVEASLKADGA